jgi:GMP synthase (glutamine-hydrolysing)
MFAHVTVARAVLLISHLPYPQFGLIDEARASPGLHRRLVQSDAPGAALPSLDEVSAVISLGGQMSVLDADRHPILPEEMDMIRDAVERDVPLLGLCLGAQLLAAATGGAVTHLPVRQLAWETMTWRPAADADPLLRGLGPRVDVLEWHGDGIVPPPHAVVLAETEAPGCSLFRVGRSAWGSQMHLETSPAQILAQLEDPVDRGDVTDAGYDVDEFRTEALRRLPGQMTVGRAVLGRFAALVARRERHARPDRPAATTAQRRTAG